MLGFLPAPLLGVLSAVFALLNLIFWAIPALALVVVKLLTPRRSWRSLIKVWIEQVALLWTAGNFFVLKLTRSMRWDVSGAEFLSRRGRYFFVPNHQSWVDVLALQHVLLTRAPFLKFFLKRELIWVPILGQVWWALEYPFMRRHTRAQIARDPSLKGKDLETTKRFCARLRNSPMSIVNFVEGTRFTKEKHDKQSSPFKHLLKPRAGGLAFALEALGDQLHCIVDVTIFYPGHRRTLWDFLSGRIRHVVINVRELPVPLDIVGDYSGNPEHRARFHTWLNQLWKEKDLELQRLAADHRG